MAANFYRVSNGLTNAKPGMSRVALAILLILLTLACVVPTSKPVTPAPEALLTPAPAVLVTPLLTPVGNTYRVCNCETLNVRSAPGIDDGAVVAWLRNLQQVQVSRMDGDWAELVGGGWVHKGFLCVVTK